MPFAEAVAAQYRAARSGARPAHRLSQQQRVRHDKLSRLVEAGRQPYPVSVPRGCEVAGLRERFAGLPPDTRTGQQVSVAGRVRALRDFGGLTFATLQDGTASIQALFSRAELGAAEHRLLRSTLDLGDFISVTGEVLTSRHGELSVLAGSWQMAAKCLRPLPDATPASPIRRPGPGCGTST